MVGVISVLVFLDDLVFAAADDTAIRAWDFASGTLKYTYSGHFSKVTSLQIPPDKKSMVSCGRDKVIIVWDIVASRAVRTIAVYESLESLVLLPNSLTLPDSAKRPKKGTFVACAGEKGVLRVWNADPAAELYVSDSFISAGSSSDAQGIKKLMICPERNSLAVISSDHTIFFVATDDKLSVSKQMVGFSDEIFDVVFMGENQSHLAVATNSSVIKLYTVSNMACQLLKGHSDLVISLTSTPANPNLLVSGAKDNSIRLWLMNGEGSVNCIASGTRHTSSVTSVALGRNNANLLVSAGEDTTLKIWSLPKKFNTNSIEALSVKCTEVAHEKDINGICIAPNDKIMATASLDKTAKLWSTSDLSLMGVLKGHKRGVWSAKFSPVDQVLATTSADSTLRLWSLSDLSCLKTFEGHGFSVLRVEFLSRGLQLVSVGSDGLMKLWCIKSSECMATFDQHDGKVWALAVSKDEQVLVTGGDDSKLQFWADATEAARLEAANERQTRVEHQQRLDNLIHNHMLLPALELALRLERPATVLKIVTKLQQESAESLDDVIRKLDVDKKGSLLKCVISWNSNSKQSYSAQVVLSVLLDDIIKGDLRVPSSDMESLIMFSDRHFKRLTQMQQDLQILKYTANIMLPHAK